MSVADGVYILRLGSDGQVAALSPVPGAMSKSISGRYPALLSPAGTEIAFTNSTERRLLVVTVATGAIRSWKARPGFLGALQWPGTGNNVLSELFNFNEQPGLSPTRFRLLDVGGTGGSVLATPGSSTACRRSSGMVTTFRIR